jgi:hypothetical protein
MPLDLIACEDFALISKKGDIMSNQRWLSFLEVDLGIFDIAGDWEQGGRGHGGGGHMMGIYDKQEYFE